MSGSPSWVHKFDGSQRPRSQSVQPGSASYWDARKSPYQPLKWQPEYGAGGSPVSRSPVPNSSPNQGSRSSIPHSGSRASLISKVSSGANLHTIPEDHFLDRGTDFRFAGGVRNPVFEMSEFSSPGRSQNRRFSEGDLLEGGFQRSYNRNDNSPFRPQNIGPSVNAFNMDDPRQDRRKSVRDIRSEMRSETRSDVSVGARSGQSARSGRSESATSDKSEDTKLTSVTSSRNDRRQSETGSKSGERRPSAAPSRRSADSSRSSSTNGNNKSEPSVLTASPIEIPIEFLETPATRIKKLFGPVIMCVLVITLAGSLGAAIYFATVLKEAQEQTIDLLKAQLEMSTSGVNVQTLSLRQRQTLTKDYCQQMDQFYTHSSLFEKTYKSCEVDALTSSKIKFTLYFDDKEEEATRDNIVEVLIAQAKHGDNPKQVEVNQLKLDLDTVKVTLEKVKAAESETPPPTKSQPQPQPPTNPRPQPPAKSTTTLRPVTPPALEVLPAAKPHTQGPVSTPSTTTKTPESSKTALDVTQTMKTAITPLTPKSTPSPRPTTERPNICANKSGDYFQHHRECNLYIQCHDGEMVTNACPQTTVFDIKEKVCVKKTDHVICPEKPITAGYDWTARDPWDPCRKDEGNQYFPYPEDCNLFFQCQHNISTVRLCPKDTIFDTVNQNCMPPSPDIICYTLSTTAATARGTAASHTVTSVHGSSTGSTTTLPPIVYPSRPDYSAQPCKDGKNGGLYAHPTNCSHYILCEYKNERIRSCAEGLYFDPDIKTCIQPRNDLRCPDIRPCKDLVNGLFPHPRICSEFITCNNGQEVIQKCMHETVWDPRSNTCVPKTDSVTCPEVRR